METETLWQDMMEWAHTNRRKTRTRHERVRSTLGWMIFTFVATAITLIAMTFFFGAVFSPWLFFLFIPIAFVLTILWKFMSWYDSKYNIGWW